MSHAALGEEQSRLIRVVADGLQPEMRQAFIASVADKLQPLRYVGTSDIIKAIDATRASFDYDDCDDCY